MTKNSNQQYLWLKIGDTPLYPFVNAPFSVPIFLFDDKDQLKYGWVSRSNN